MKLSYFSVAADVPSGIIPESSVVIDVLRATTTIAWALENGADSVQVFADIDELKNEAKSFSEKDKILVGVGFFHVELSPLFRHNVKGQQR